MNKDPATTLKWLEENQPKNIVAINSLRQKLGLALLPVSPPKPPQSVIASVVGDENKRLRALRTFLPGHEPDR